MYSRIVKKWKIGNRKFGFWILASTLTREPPSRWCSGETPPQGGQLGRGPDENAISQRSTVTVDNSRQDRQELVFWHEKTLHFLMFYSCKKSTFWVAATVHSQQRQSTRPPGGSLLTQKSTAFPSVLLLQELDEFSTVNSQQQIKFNYNFN